MAGIGFELRKLLRTESYLGLLRAYTYASIISSGPWVFSIVGLIAIGVLSLGTVYPDALIVQFQVTVTYLIMGSLVFTGGLQLAFTRWVADRLFEKRPEVVVPNFLGVTLVTTALSGTLAWGVAWFGFREASHLYRVLLVSGFALLNNIWVATVLLSGLKQYRSILWLYGGGYGLSVGLAWALRPLGMEGLFAGFLGGQFALWFGMVALILRNFPLREPMSLACLGRRQMYPELLLAGLFYNLGVWIDKLVFWWSEPTSQHIIGWLRASVIYDLPVFLAYLCVIPGMGIFLVKFETDFVEWYDKFYNAVREGGSLHDIAHYHDRMQETVREGLYQIMKVQTITLLAVYTFVPSLFDWIGISDLYIPLFLVQAAAASFQVMLLAVLNVLYYLDRRREVVAVTASLTVLNLVLSRWSIELGAEFFGYGLALALLGALLLGLSLVQRLFRKLEYQTFMLQ
ncbi:exopolysaccharide Pel transporter PelG [Caldimonas sp.]|uniref:exopolysaccharide Pel transporter PelG n=1 Tax=Caldimonas sp. TaxID=2838790 RepID=UPI003919510D